MRPSLSALAFVLLVAAAPANDRLIETVAGTGKGENNGREGPAREFNIGQPFGVEIGPDGALYITEVGNHRVLRLDLKTKRIKTVAGSGKKGYAGDGGPATEAELNEPYEVRFDPAGNMYFVEMMNHLVRRVDAKTGRISTVAGTGQAGFGGDGGPAVRAQLCSPHSIVVDNRGNLYIADIGNHRVRRIDLRTGTIETITGNGERTFPPDGAKAKGSPIPGPRALALEGQFLWIVLREGHGVWKMDLREGTLHHVAGTGKAGYTGDGGPAKQATFNGPKGLALGPRGDVYVMDSENEAVRKIDRATGVVTTIAGHGRTRSYGGDGGPAVKASFSQPHGICVGADGSVYIGDTINHRVRRVAPSAKEKQGFNWEGEGYRWKHFVRDMAPFPPAPSVPAVHDPDAPVWAYLQFRMRKALGDLARLYMTLHPPPAPGTITTYNDSTWHMGWWPDYVVLTGDAEVRDYCYAWRDSFVHSVKHNVSNFAKGYVKRGDIDHQNEDIVRFLLPLRSIDPKDPANTFNVRAMAPLLGNWDKDVQPWYDWDKHRWRGYWLGTEYVKAEDHPDDLSPFAWLCLIALAAYRDTGESRYLRLVEDFCTHQGADIAARGLKSPLLGIGVFGGAFNKENFYGETYGFGPWKGGTFRLGFSLAGVGCDLYQLTGKKDYLQTARLFLDHTVPDMLYHTRGESSVGEFLQYRRITGDTRYDKDVLDWLERTRDRVDSLHAVTEPTDAADRKYDWLHGCETRNSPSPKAYNLAYLITGREEYLDRAVEMALDRTRAVYAEEYRPSTRARMPGDWNWFSYVMAWEVADAFFPTVGKQYGGTNGSLDTYEVRFLHEDGKQGLPRHVAAQYLPRAGSFDERRLRFYNASDAATTVRVRVEDVRRVSPERIEGPDAGSARVEGGDVLVSLLPHRTARLTVLLTSGGS